MIYSVLGNHSDELASQERLQRLTQWVNAPGGSCTPISGGATAREKKDFQGSISVKSDWNKNIWISQNAHHVEIGADFDSSGQVPNDAIPIMSCREKDSGIEGVGLQNKHFILMTLNKKKYIHKYIQNWDVLPKVQYSSSGHASFVTSHCYLTLNVVQYHEDVDEVATGGIPHFQRQIVGRCYHRAVVAIPRDHGNLQLCHFVF